MEITGFKLLPCFRFTCQDRWNIHKPPEKTVSVYAFELLPFIHAVLLTRSLPNATIAGEVRKQKAAELDPIVQFDRSYP